MWLKVVFHPLGTLYR